MDKGFIKQTIRDGEFKYDAETSPVIIVGLCSYRYIESGCVAGLLNLAAQRAVSGYSIIEGTILPHARNDIVNLIYENHSNFTHVLFIDADQCDFISDDVKKLYEADKDVIGGITVQRAGEHRITLNPLEPHRNIVDKVIEVHHTGFFFTLVKRAVLDAMGEEVTGDEKKRRIWFSTDRFTRQGFDKEIDEFIEKQKCPIITGSGSQYTEEAMREAIAFGRMATTHSCQVGEDVGFCWKARHFGFGVFAHTGVRLGHIGSKIFHPNEYLKASNPDDGKHSTNRVPDRAKKRRHKTKTKAISH